METGTEKEKGGTAKAQDLFSLPWPLTGGKWTRVASELGDGFREDRSLCKEGGTTESSLMTRGWNLQKKTIGKGGGPRSAAE